jgi:hypothetical protein
MSGVVDRISDFVAESGNPGNEKRLTRLLLVYPSTMLPNVTLRGRVIRTPRRSPPRLQRRFAT